MKKGVLLGSSIFEQWTSAQGRYDGFQLENHAIGGTTADYWAQEIDIALARTDYDFVVLYAGSNDFNQGRSVDAITESLGSCITTIRTLLGKNSVAYASIIQAPQKRELGLSEAIEKVNRQIFDLLEPTDLALNLNDALANENEANLYVEDKLHLTDKAYSLMSAYVIPRLEQWLKAKA
ncbi:MAG: hypothetical protein KC422_22935 [Trueperaceae bacterium]|nr:hypothetical protein [Trueperaceae bacterium]